MMQQKIIKFSILVIIYIAVIFWLEIYWLLLGIYFIFDAIFLQKIVRKRNKKVSNPYSIRELITIITISATMVWFTNTFFFQNYKIPSSSMEGTLRINDYLFVSKIHYGPRLPMTVWSVPFLHNVLPFTANRPSFSDAWILPFKRLRGFSSIAHNDVIVFNFPEGDTVLQQAPSQNYYELVSEYGRQNLSDNFTIRYRPVDKRENYVKRCIALPGDTLKIQDGIVFINNIQILDAPETQHFYIFKIKQDTNPLADICNTLNMDEDEIDAVSENEYGLMCSKKQSQLIDKMPDVINTQKLIRPAGEWYSEVFPHNEHYYWNDDYFGPLYIPAKGDTLWLNNYSLPLYERLIETYEHNTFTVQHDTAYINGKAAQYYITKQNYYFVMGDSRHNSADSRYWGFLPEDHIVGKPLFIYFSYSSESELRKGIRWNRIFSKIQ